jgi:polyisoprenoid-binding protein YceI
MKKTLLVVVASLMLTASAANVARAEKWNIDVAHSTLTFEVSHMVISKAKGRFTDFTGSIHFKGEDVADGSVEIVAQTASVDTDNEDRDKHLRSDEFFETEKYPTMSFKSTKVGKVKDGKFTLTGNLTIKDVTKEVTFDCEFRGVVKDPWGNTRSGFSAATTINRQDFNVSWSSLLDGGGLTLGNDVDLKLEIEATKAKPEEKSAESKK